jgi:2-polyprenyl-3-methyl-5-hydroxy-6-metoxy-1,4-benzoquinol methylase
VIFSTLDHSTQERTHLGKHYYEYIRSEILPLLPNTVSRTLEVGCGAGNTLTWLQGVRQCTWLGGVELSHDAAEQARRKLDIVYEGNIERIELPLEPNSLDLILCLDVLEHLIDPWAVVHRLQPLLKSGGALIASLPNVRYRKVLLPLLLHEKWDYVDEGVLDRTHLRFFVRSTAIQLIESSGLKVDRIETTGLGKSRKSKIFNAMLPSPIKSLFERQYLVRGIKVSTGA